MALMTHRAAAYSPLLSRTGTAGASKFDDAPAITGQTSFERHAAQYRICLECALPLKTSEHRQSPACSCAQEKADDEWMDIGGWEIAFILGLVIACMAVTFWSCI